MTKKSNFFLKNIAPPLAVFLLFMTIWSCAVNIWDIPPFIFPKPSQVYATAYENLGSLLYGTWLTGLAAFVGFACSLILGIVIALIFAESSIFRYGFYPYAIFLQTVPIIAIAPLIVIWFGNGLQSVIIVSFIMSLFPIITNVTTGLINIKQELLDLFLVNKASRLQILFKLRFPHTVPYLVAGAKISSGLCVIGAIVGEFFAGFATQHYGLGYIITVSSGQLKIDYLFSAVFMSTFLSLLFFYSTSFIGNLILVKWRFIK